MSRLGFIGAAAALLIGCSSSSGVKAPPSPSPEAGVGTDAGPPAPTFTNVMKLVITKVSCGGLACHDSPLGGFTFGAGAVSPAKVYAQLINQEAGGALCRAGTVISGGDAGADAGDAGPLKVQGKHIRVIPGDPDNSLLYQKLAGDPPCGDPMPKGGIPDGDKIQLVKDWIALGAKND